MRSCTGSNKKAEVQAQKQKISEKNDKTTQTEEEVGIQAALGKALTSTKEAFISGRVNRIVKDGLKNAYDAIPFAGTIGWTFTAVDLLINLMPFFANQRFDVATDTSPNAVNPIAKDLGNHTLSSNSRHIPVSLQVTMENKTNEYSKKLDDALESAKNNFGIPQVY